MNREAMVETGAREIYEKCLSHGRDWRRLGPSGKEKVLAQSRAVLDAVLPQITSVEQIQALPEYAILMLDNDEGIPYFYLWSRGEIRDMEGDGTLLEPRDLIEVGDPLTIVWRPDA